MAPDRSRRDGMGDTARCGGSRASYPAALHVARALRWRKPNSWDNNGTRQEAGDRVPPDIRARIERGASALSVARQWSRHPVTGKRLGRLRRYGPPLHELGESSLDVRGEIREGSSIGLRPDPDDQVRGDVGGKEACSGQLPKSALDAVSGHR